MPQAEQSIRASFWRRPPGARRWTMSLGTMTGTPDEIAQECVRLARAKDTHVRAYRNPDNWFAYTGDLLLGEAADRHWRPRNGRNAIRWTAKEIEAVVMKAIDSDVMMLRRGPRGGGGWFGATAVWRRIEGTRCPKMRELRPAMLRLARRGFLERNSAQSDSDAQFRATAHNIARYKRLTEGT